MTLHDLRDARLSGSGGKAAALGTLLRAGIDVPPGIVVPVREHHRHLLRDHLDPGRSSPAEMREAIARMRVSDDLVRALDGLLRPGSGRTLGGPVAVRSSATSEDGASASAAGQHDSVLAVRGTEAVCAAILQCWASLWSERAVAYREGGQPVEDPGPQMAVIVQQFLDADVSGVLFTGEQRILEAVQGRGEQLVGGDVTPDSWRIDRDGIRAARAGGAGRTGEGAEGLCLSEVQVHELDVLGEQVSRALGTPADIEWSLVGDRFRVLQARPITAAVPALPGPGPVRSGTSILQGTPASGGRATGMVRIVRGPQDFRRVRQGDVLICRSTDPAWTPLFRIAGAVVTEVGGVLSHAAIVARELGIPAVLAVPGAVEGIPDGSLVTVDGDEGLLRLEAVPGTGLRAQRPAPEGG